VPLTCLHNKPQVDPRIASTFVNGGFLLAAPRASVPPAATSGATGNAVTNLRSTAGTTPWLVDHGDHPEWHLGDKGQLCAARAEGVG